MLDNTIDRIRKNEATDDERNKFASEIKIIIKSYKSKMNQEIARRNRLEYEDMLNEVANFTYECVIKYKFNTKITTRVYKIVDWYTEGLHRKSTRKKIIPPDFIDTYLSSQRQENLKYFGKDPDTENLNFDKVLTNKKDNIENDLIYSDYIEKIRRALIKRNDIISLKILDGKLKGLTDAMIAKTLKVSTPKVNCIKRTRLTDVVSQILC
jgi:hypothetical protein